MGFKDYRQLMMEYEDPVIQERLGDLYAIRQFFLECLLSDGYKPDEALAEAICLTSKGLEIEEFLKESRKDISLVETKLAIFHAFCHDELFIDLEKTNIEKILEILESDIISRKIKFPWIYDRELYDRFFDLFDEVTDELSYKQTEEI